MADIKMSQKYSHLIDSSDCKQITLFMHGNIVTAIKDYKQGHPYRCDRHGYINIGIGKVSELNMAISILV